MAQLNSLIVTGDSRFLNTINGDISGTSSNVTGTVAIANGGTGATTAANARTNLGAAASSHTHGNIANGGTITSTAVTPANTDYLLMADASNSGKIERGVAIGTGTTKFLREDGTWQTPAYPTVNNAALNLQLGGTTKKTFTANASSAVTANFVFTAGTTPSTVTKKTVVTTATVANRKLTISTGDSVTVTAGTAPSLAIN